MIAKRIRDYLDENGISYEVVNHSQAFTAQKIAASAHISGKEVAKTVIVKADGDMLMVVLPAHRQLDLMKLKQFLKADEITLAEENEFQRLFPDCEVGAMPPFG
ncbi:MAG: YbaK/EbsC family protein, partial [Gammaproteobacteria bacterium]|nr:YbaK/EbsC family protein [Gammaproteobacteria bacterium]NIR95574.1 YbaK/EbsC family protein [Gammaproteobacteria bacterium]NIW45671.1 deacylase [Gammaproteobacteria bacterium]NIX58549.1 deacylase [candidate division Zixibacteria bacterium]